MTSSTRTVATDTSDVEGQGSKTVAVSKHGTGQNEAREYEEDLDGSIGVQEDR